MFESTFKAELASLVGRRVDIYTQYSEYDGVITGVEKYVVRLTEFAPGYETQARRVIVPIEAISYVEPFIPVS